MIRAVAPPLPAALAEGLAALTDGVRAAPDPGARFQRAEALWESRLRSDRPLGRQLRSLLDEVGPGEARLCRWCELNEGDTVDHIAPKRWAPLLAFTYENLLPACGRCQSFKGDRWALVAGGALVALRGQAPPPDGEPALISPRDPHEDPLDLLTLELETGAFVGAEEPPRARLRAEFTVELLGLNTRGSLVSKRRRAYGDYLGWLRDAVEAEEGSDDRAAAKRKIQGSRFPCVWGHMKRQSGEAPLAALFARLPEALGW
jgi:hypothetical protein